MDTDEQQWLQPASPPALAAGEVHIWSASLQAEAPLLRRLQTYLSASEREKAAKFHFVHDQQHFTVAHGVLRLLLAWYLQTDARALVFTTNEYGKPSVALPGRSESLFFNLSHSHEMALFAFTDSHELGVDIEYKRKGIDYDELARFCFSPYEQKVLASLEGEEKHEAFYNCWSRKEAYIKARGMGLSLPLDLFDVSLRPGEPARLVGGRKSEAGIERWSLRALDPVVEYAAAVALESQQWTLRTYRWSPALL